MLTLRNDGLILDLSKTQTPQNYRPVACLRWMLLRCNAASWFRGTVGFTRLMLLGFRDIVFEFFGRSEMAKRYIQKDVIEHF